MVLLRLRRTYSLFRIRDGYNLRFTPQEYRVPPTSLRSFSLILLSLLVPIISPSLESRISRVSTRSLYFYTSSHE